MTPREARDRWLDKLRVQRRKQTVSSYKYRLKLFVEWAESKEIERVSELSGWDLESYEAHRRSQEPSMTSLNNELGTLKLWLEYLAQIDVVDPDLPEKVDIPEVSADERSSDVRLSHDRAETLIQHYRETPSQYGTRGHVLLELCWYTGARIGGLRSLDVRDLRRQEFDDSETAFYVVFANRPDTDTPLKKGPDGGRPVAIPRDVYDVVDHYVQERRPDIYDDQGRQPLLPSQRGRPSPGTIRDWMYLATLPCVAGSCPHERDPDSCEYTRYSHASKCPSSRSPHQVRTGAITWMRNQGMPAEIVAERVNSSVEVIEQHYDVEDPVQQMLYRRIPYVTTLSFSENEP